MNSRTVSQHSNSSLFQPVILSNKYTSEFLLRLYRQLFRENFPTALQISEPSWLSTLLEQASDSYSISVHLEQQLTDSKKRCEELKAQLAFENFLQQYIQHAKEDLIFNHETQPVQLTPTNALIESDEFTEREGVIFRSSKRRGASFSNPLTDIPAKPVDNRPCVSYNSPQGIVTNSNQFQNSTFQNKKCDIRTRLSHSLDELEVPPLPPKRQSRQSQAYVPIPPPQKTFFVHPPHRSISPSEVDGNQQDFYEPVETMPTRPSQSTFSNHSEPISPTRSTQSPLDTPHRKVEFQTGLEFFHLPSNNNSNSKPIIMNQNSTGPEEEEYQYDQYEQPRSRNELENSLPSEYPPAPPIPSYSEDLTPPNIQKGDAFSDIESIDDLEEFLGSTIRSSDSAYSQTQALNAPKESVNLVSNSYLNNSRLSQSPSNYIDDEKVYESVQNGETQIRVSATKNGTMRRTISDRLSVDFQTDAGISI